MNIQNYSGDYLIKMLKDLYDKTGVQPPQSDLDTLQRLVDEERARYEKVKSWARVSDSRIGASNLDIPIGIVYSQILEQDTASIKIKVPPIYNHILIQGQGRISGSSGGTVFCQFNDDTDSNYSWVYLQGNGTSATSSKDASDVRIPIGQFSNSGDPEGSASIFEAKINHYHANTHQMVLAQTLYNDGVTNSVYQIGGKWSNVSGIDSIEMFAADGTGVKGSTNFLAGSAFSVVGFK